MMHRCLKCKSKMVSCKRAFVINRYFCPKCLSANTTGVKRTHGSPSFESWFSRHYSLLSVNGKVLGILPITTSSARADVPKKKKQAKVAAT